MLLEFVLDAWTQTEFWDLYCQNTFGVITSHEGLHKIYRKTDENKFLWGITKGSAALGKYVLVSTRDTQSAQESHFRYKSHAGEKVLIALVVIPPAQLWLHFTFLVLTEGERPRPWRPHEAIDLHKYIH